MNWFDKLRIKPKDKDFAPPKKKDFEKPKIPGRVSTPAYNSEYYTNLQNNLLFVRPPWVAELIPVIRKLSWINPDISVAFSDLVNLTNTGHKINFDKTVSSKQVDKMRFHLSEKSKTWMDGVAGTHGAVGKIIGQIYIAGATSVEAVPNNQLDGLSGLVLVNPETILFEYSKGTGRYTPYQKPSTTLLSDTTGNTPEIKLNPNTYRYFSIQGDTEIPYGIPPFLAALESISTQRDMVTNFRFIIKQLGLLGFFETLLQKPDQMDNESETAYVSRLNKLLTETKTNVQGGLMDGNIVGYEGDHQFEFHSTTQNLTGVHDLYSQNEVQIANGLKYSPSFLGIDTKAEAALTIIFTKMLSQLKNVQSTAKAILEFAYTLELRLAGYNFKYLSVDFNPSTITDDLKTQQALEIKIRNARVLYADGIISQETYADIMGYEAPDKGEPRVPLNPDKVIEDNGKKVQRKKDKTKSDGDTKRKRKEQPKDPKPRN